MANDTLFLNIDGASHHTYMHDEAEGYRIVIDNRTVMFEKENDPQILRATSPGKLIKYLVNDGDHVDKEQVFFLHKVHISLSPFFPAHKSTSHYLSLLNIYITFVYFFTITGILCD